MDSVWLGLPEFAVLGMKLLALYVPSTRTLTKLHPLFLPFS